MGQIHCILRGWMWDFLKQLFFWFFKFIVFYMGGSETFWVNCRKTAIVSKSLTPTHVKYDGFSNFCRRKNRTFSNVLIFFTTKVWKSIVFYVSGSETFWNNCCFTTVPAKCLKKSHIHSCKIRWICRTLLKHFAGTIVKQQCFKKSHFHSRKLSWIFIFFFFFLRCFKKSHFHSS